MVLAFGKSLPWNLATIVEGESLPVWSMPSGYIRFHAGLFPVVVGVWKRFGAVVPGGVSLRVAAARRHGVSSHSA